MQEIESRRLDDVSGGLVLVGAAAGSPTATSPIPGTQFSSDTGIGTTVCFPPPPIETR